MIVTRIEELSRSRYRIYLDEVFAFVLYKGELHLYGIREGEEMQEGAYQQIQEVLLPKRATLRAMNLLKSRPYTEHQIREKLAQGFFPRESIERAVAYVKSYHYVDDARYAEAYIRSCQEKKSRRVMEMDLARKGISGDVIEEAFRSLAEQGNEPDEEQLAAYWMRKKHFTPQEADYTGRQKMAAFLYRKGIGSEVIRRVLSVD